MKRVYLDTNVFSNLRRNNELLFQQINDSIAKYLTNLSFVFSPPHIRDKKKDLSEKKLLDFQFMERLVKDNYLCYHGNDKRSSFYIATPQIVFDENEAGGDLDEIKHFWEIKVDDDPLIKAMKESFKMIFSKLNLDLPLASDENTFGQQAALIRKIIPDKPGLTMWDMIENFTAFGSEMYSNFTTYKDLRKIIDESFNAGKYHVNGQFDFNEAFKESRFKQTFLEYVLETMHEKRKENVPFYNYYIQCFLCLDIFGISKDQVTKKNDFNNLFNDALHSYYAHYCDYFVTDDEVNRNKSSALFKLLGITTKVMTPAEFFDILPVDGADSEKTIGEFFDKLWNDIKLNQETGMESNNTYLNFFNAIKGTFQNEGWHFYLWKKPTNILSNPNFREIGQMVDKCVRFFGMDHHKKAFFDSSSEVPQLREGKWQGRQWPAGDVVLMLLYDNKLNDLLFSISTGRPAESGNDIN